MTVRRNFIQTIFYGALGSAMISYPKLAYSNSLIKKGIVKNANVPQATWHGLKNTGTETLIFTFGFSPSGFEDYFRQVGTLKGLPFKPKPQEILNQLAVKYGMVFK